MAEDVEGFDSAVQNACQVFGVEALFPEQFKALKTFVYGQGGKRKGPRTTSDVWESGYLLIKWLEFELGTLLKDHDAKIMHHTYGIMRIYNFLSTFISFK